MSLQDQKNVKICMPFLMFWGRGKRRHSMIMQ